MDSRSNYLIQKLKTEIANEKRISNTTNSSFNVAMQFLEDVWNYIINNIKLKHPDYNEQQILLLIRAQNQIEIKMRNQLRCKE
jgi:hypothetical protein